MNEAGRYEFQPDEWEYVENFTVEKKDTVSKESSDAEASRDSKASLDAEKRRAVRSILYRFLFRDLWKLWMK